MKDLDLARVEALFHAAAELAPEGRSDYLDRECPHAGMRARVEAMLERLDEGDSLAPAASLLDDPGSREGPGTVIGRYKLLQRIGEGGFGVVYMAEQQEPVHRRVALKIIKLGMDTKEVVARFEAERQALALMDHPNIARVLDGGATESGRPYFVMELVRGVSITSYCDENSLTTRERLRLFVPVCHAVQHAHQKGVIHRDIKPSNVMVTLHDGRPVPKVIDFGVAKAMHTRLTEKTLFTAYERFIGTPAYMSPEQAELSGLDVDTRTDIYALGVLLYELLTGTTPFDTKRLLEDGLLAVQRTIREEPPQRPSLRISTSGSAEVASRRRADVPSLSRIVRGDLDWIVMKCLEKERVRRYETASELAADVERHLRHEPVLAGPPSALYRTRKLLERNRAAVLSAAVLLLGLLVGVIGLGVGLIQADRKRGEAESARLLAEREAERTRAVTDFLLDTLAQTAPDVALDANLSVATLLDRASSRAAEAFQDHPEAEARLRVTIGRGYKALGRNKLAEDSLRRGIELLQRIDGVEAPELYAAMWDLTHVLFALERPDAMVVAQEARRVAHDHVRRSHPRLAECLDRFVELSNDTAFSLDEDAAERLPAAFVETVRVSDATLPIGDPLWPIVADTWMASGYSVWYGPYDEFTVRFFGRALEIQQRELPPNHPQVGETTGLYVNALNRNGRAAEAESIMRASVGRLRRVLPPGSPQLAAAEGMLGENLVSQGRYAEAEPLLLSSHAVIVESIGEEQDFTVADSQARLLTLYEEWGREEEAAPLRDRLATFCATAPILMPWPILRRAFGPGLEELRAGMDRLDGILSTGTFSIGTYSSRRGAVTDPDVPRLMETIAGLRRASFADDDPRSILTARQLLVWANELAPGLGETSRERVIEDALAVLEPHSDELAPELARGRVLLCELAHRQGDAEQAISLGREAWRLLHGRTGDWLLANVKVRVARALVDLGLYPEAESLLVPSLERIVASFGPQNPDAEAARELLVETYTAWGRPEDARTYADPGPDSSGADPQARPIR